MSPKDKPIITSTRNYHDVEDHPEDAKDYNNWTDERSNADLIPNAGKIYLSTFPSSSSFCALSCFQT
jgi:hypothetical protein